MFWMARMCSFENLSGRRKSYSLIVRSVTLGTLPPLAPEALSSLPMLFSSASISHWASVLLIRLLPVGAPYRQEGRQVESHTARNYWTVVLSLSAPHLFSTSRRTTHAHHSLIGRMYASVH